MPTAGLERRLRAWRATVRIAIDMARTWSAPATRWARTAASFDPATLMRTCPGASRSAPPRGDIRLVTWNIHRDYDRIGIARGLARLCGELDPALLLLQEVPVAGEVGFWERDGVAPLLARHGVTWAAMHRVLRRDVYYDFDASGQLTGSRLPLVASEVIALPVVSTPKLGAAHRVRRIALVTTVEVGTSRVSVANLHLENTARPAGRAHQLAALLARLDAGPAVIAGDLNTMFGRFEPLWRVIARAGFEPLTTTPRRRLVPRLDHVLVRGLKGVECRELAIAGSDHRPLVATVALHSR